MAKKAPEYRRFACGIVVKQLPPVATILKYFTVDLESGLLFHREIPGNEAWNKNWCQNPAGYSNSGSGYVSLKIEGIAYQVHRLLWKISTGSDPRGVIDHINGVRDDNRICNLRDVMPLVNAQNAVNGRWLKVKMRRAAEAKKEREDRIEARERELLARLKAKYELAESPSIESISPQVGAASAAFDVG
jgi:hypothetical protein